MGRRFPTRSSFGSEGSRVLRFIVAGGTNLVATYALFLAGFLFLGLHYLAANLFAFLAWAWFGFEIQRVWVFKKKRSVAAFFKYVLNQLVFFGVSTLLLFIAVDTVGIRPELAYLVVVAIVGIGMYLSSILFVFRKSTPI